MKFKFTADIYTATLYRFAVALFLLWLTRFAFALYNPDTLAGATFGQLMALSAAGLRFDLSAAAYFNIPFILMSVLPFAFVTRRGWQKAGAWVYGICNGLLLAINLADVPYYRFTGARLRWSNIANVTTDGGIGNIASRYALEYWWVVLLFAAIVALMMWAFLRVRVATRPRPLWLRLLMLVVFAGAAFITMRGRVGAGVPLAIPDAATAVYKAPQINVVLNSPFTILRSLNRTKANTETEVTFFSDEDLARLRTSLHPGTGEPDSLLRRNIVTIIIESGGSEWISPLMPFLDSLRRESLTFENTLACSRASCGGATAVLAGFPAFDPFYFMLSPYNKNRLDAPAALLGTKGWTAAFFYGCNHGSFNIDQTAFAAGYRHTFGREDYPGDDYDGVWGIFDRPMARFVVDRLSALPQPFIAAWFTISAHGPWTLPDGYDTSAFIHPERSPERGLEYTDQALRDFFRLASRQPWYAATTFIITADHGNRDFRETRFDTPYLRSRIPFIIYTPDRSVAPRVVDDRALSQHDIAPTLLGLLRWPDPYVAVGADALDDSVPHFGIHRHDGGRYLVTSDRYIILTSPDLRTVDEIYDRRSDPEMARPLAPADIAPADSTAASPAEMLRWARAFMQDYTKRLIHDRLAR